MLSVGHRVGLDIYETFDGMSCVVPVTIPTGASETSYGMLVDPVRCIEYPVGHPMGRPLELVTSHGKAHRRLIELPMEGYRPHRTSRWVRLCTDRTSHGTWGTSYAPWERP